MRVSSVTGSCQSVFRLGNVLWCVCVVGGGGGGGGGYVCLCDVKSKCRLRQLLIHSKRGCVVLTLF